MKYLITQPHEVQIKEMAVCDRPRERMLSNGAEALADQELLSILISSGNRGRSVTAIARDLLALLDRKQHISHEDLMQIPGLGTAKATLVCAALELGRRRLPPRRRQISTPSDIYPLVRHYATRMQEHFLSVVLNGAHELLSINVCSIGLVNRTIVHPRDVLTSHLIQSYWGKKGKNPSRMRYFKVFSMLEGPQSDIYQLRKLLEPELVCSLKPSDWHTGEKSICATIY